MYGILKEVLNIIFKKESFNIWFDHNAHTLSIFSNTSFPCSTKATRETDTEKENLAMNQMNFNNKGTNKLQEHKVSRITVGCFPKQN